ncbi:MAG: hypothetical protein ACJA01_004251, partial [Saprospiraceae bacterium]
VHGSVIFFLILEKSLTSCVSSKACTLRLSTMALHLILSDWPSTARQAFHWLLVELWIRKYE